LERGPHVQVAAEGQDSIEQRAHALLSGRELGHPDIAALRGRLGLYGLATPVMLLWLSPRLCAV
jgi:hypothetical protein